MIPKKFQILGQTWTVQYPNKVIVEGESVLGSCDSDHCIIQIRKNLKKELKELTFYHELTHAILDTMEYRKLSADETFVERISKALYQIMKTMN